MVRVLIVSAAKMENVGDNVVSLVNEGLVWSYSEAAEVRYADLNEHPQSDVLWSDLVIVGGGGIIYDWAIENVDNYMQYIDLAKYARKTVIVSGVGVQGISTDYAKRRYRETLNRADCLIVRDAQDAQELAEIGVMIPIQTLPDLAVLLPELLPILQQKREYAPSDQIADLLQRKQQSKKPFLGVSLSSEEGAALNKNVDEAAIKERQASDDKKIKALKSLENEYQIVLLPHSRDDLAMYERADEHLSHAINLRPFGHKEVLGILDVYRAFDVVLTSRYHGFLLASLIRKPVAIITGENTKKIQKTIHSQLPVFRSNVLEISELAELSGSSIRALSSFTDQHDNEVNQLIEKAARYHDYFGAVMHGLAGL